MSRTLIGLGAVLIALGLTGPWVRRWPLFRLPGDLVIERPEIRLFLSLTTMLLVSVVFSILAWLLGE